MISLLKAHWGIPESEISSKLTSRLSDDHKNLRKDQLRKSENDQTINTKTEKHTTSLTVQGGGSGHKTKLEAKPYCWNNEMLDPPI